MVSVLPALEDDTQRQQEPAIRAEFLRTVEAWAEDQWIGTR